ncbi:TauD/TfdA dioxygenase family protein [Pararobbsia silviterrae]|uniref:Taurine catabolism dioxygenase TauD n=1 Tax=Pararobbsia silviterrae TaxID=1792498 RepID=A0A494XZZ4_9BURK|nr:TauD/TfdA family dioxygenase [Pararobbsia silviterrae]RKP53766.1 taurine catabolism dioxygenase TauD [Pararobbsia silviterrae]
MTSLPELLPASIQFQNSESVQIRKWRPALGAAVSGLQYTGGPLEPKTLDALRQALFDHGLLTFAPGILSAENFTEFLDNFGDVTLYGGPKTPAATQNGQANIVDSTSKRNARNYIWHIDQAFRPNPPALTALFGQNVPSFGGDTLFSNAALAYELLDPHFAAYIETLTAVHYWDATGHVIDRFDDVEEASRQRAAHPPIETSLVRRHPITGRKQIFVNESYTAYIKGVSRTTSQSLLTILFESIKSPEVEARYQWESGALVIWDNRTLQHRGIGDFAQAQRVFLRACVA